MTLYELIETALTTKQVMADGTLAPVLARSRRAPMRSAVKRYGAFLGIDPETAGPDAYHVPDHDIRALIEAKAPARLAPNTRRNLGNDIIALLRIAVDQGWLPPLPPPFLSWRQRQPDPRRTGARRRTEIIPADRYSLGLQECPAALRDELTKYLQWCEAPVARNRPRSIVKRPVTSGIIRQYMLQLAGFAVRELHYPVEDLTLPALCQPDVLESYVNWWIARRGRVTSSLGQILVAPETIARYWLRNTEVADVIKHMQHSLPPSHAVHEKDRHWLSLQTLEEVGQSIYPLNQRRLHECWWVPYNLARDSGRRTAWWVSMSLMIRLLIRLPMRQRCFREMQLGKNLYQDHAGIWQVRFVGTELKIDTVGRAINRYEFPFPLELVPLLDEWLRKWRPRLAGPDELQVFRTAIGNPITDPSYLSKAMGRLTYRFTGVFVNPHMVRDIWATEYLNATGDVAGCARRLGNTIQMVMQRYAHIIKKDADARAETFMRGIFGAASGTSR
jgi:hypothetical protein